MADATVGAVDPASLGKLADTGLTIVGNLVTAAGFAKGGAALAALGTVLEDGQIIGVIAGLFSSNKSVSGADVHAALKAHFAGA
jgi:hypothetical protein